MTPARTEPVTTVSAEFIRAQLQRVLASTELRNSKRCRIFLTYVVEATLEGHSDRIKERSIGVEVFGRSLGYDTNDDPVVRNVAIDVRKRLAQYYQDEHRNELQIVLHHGTYVPEFRPAVAVPSAVPPPVADGRSPAERRARRRRWPLLAALALGALVVIAVTLRTPPTDLDRFWRPLVDDTEEVVLCVGQPRRVYNFTGSRHDDLDDLMVGDETSTPSPPNVLARTTVPLTSFAAAGHRYLFLGDSLCLTKIAALLEARGRRFQIRSEATTPFGDLRGRPVVLIGLKNNRWTLNLTHGLRFSIEKNLVTRKDEVRDLEHPDKPVGVVAAEALEYKVPEDYAVVTRVFDLSTEKTIVTAAGVTHLGTLAAGDFLTNDTYIREAFRDAPRDWHRRNIQVVLKVPVVLGGTGPPQVVATHFW